MDKVIRANVEKSNTKIKNIVDHFSMILRWIFRRKTLDDHVQKRLKIVGSLLDTDVICDENIWTKEESLGILNQLSKSFFLCTRNLLVEKEGKSLGFEKQQILMPSEATCYSFDNKNYNLHFEVGATTKYRISLIPINLQKDFAIEMA